jgi:hypothetical protein
LAGFAVTLRRIFHFYLALHFYEASSYFLFYGCKHRNHSAEINDFASWLIFSYKTALPACSVACDFYRIGHGCAELPNIVIILDTDFMNPILPRHEYIPDGEAHVWADGRLYLYGSRDIGGVEDYCSDRYKVFSTDDLIHWTDHGVSFEGRQVDFCPSNRLYAPDCACKDGRYYLYYCLPGEGGREGVAVSDSPTGPFTEAGPVAGADGSGIDPAVLMDDDGKAYLYWGQFKLRAARLNDDMRSIDESSLKVGLLTEEAHGFHEGASIRKIGSKYCLLYCDGERGRATCLSYALGDTPFGPFDRGGVIINNSHCDPLSWNIHGSICQFNSHWYVIYHRSSAYSKYNRRACVEPITVHPDGHIDEVQPSTQGAGGPIPSSVELGAWRACFLYGRIHTMVEGGQEFLKSQGREDLASFHDLRFSGEETRCILRLRGKGHLLVNLGSPFASSAAEIAFDTKGHWQTQEYPLKEPVSGVKSLNLFFLSGSTDLDWIRFE